MGLNKDEYEEQKQTFLVQQQQQQQQSPSQSDANYPIKFCRVCGDIALGFNYNGLCCESCKLFFRRHANKKDSNDKKFICFQNGKCLLDKNNRSFCKKCRLDKCFSIGMKKERIMIRINKRVNKANVVQHHQESSLSNTNTLITNTNTATPTSIISTNNENVDDDDDHCNSPPLPLNTLPLREQWCIDQVRSASAAIFTEETTLPVAGEATDVVFIFNLAAYYIRKMIKFCKHISPFRSLKMDDQLSVIKPCFIELLLVRESFNYNDTLDSVLSYVNEVETHVLYFNVNVLTEIEFCKDFIINYRRMISMLQREMEGDTTTRDLIKTMLIFPPNSRVSCPEFVRYYHTFYASLLRRYLLYKHGDSMVATKRYNNIIDLLSLLPKVKHQIYEIYQHFDEAQRMQVLNELYQVVPS